MTEFMKFCEVKSQMDEVFASGVSAKTLLTEMANDVFAKVPGLNKFIVKRKTEKYVLYDDWGNPVVLDEEPGVLVLFGNYRYNLSWNQTSYVVCADYTEHVDEQFTAEYAHDFFKLSDKSVSDHVRGEDTASKLIYANSEAFLPAAEHMFYWVKLFCENLYNFKFAAFNKNNINGVLEEFVGDDLQPMRFV